MKIEVVVYPSPVEDLFGAQQFCWWLSDLRIESTTQVVFSNKGTQYFYRFDDETNRDVWVAGFEALLNAKLDPIKEEEK